MKLSFLRLGVGAILDSTMVSTLQIENRPVFARVVSSLASEAGEDSIEAYQLVGDNGKPIKPKKAMIVVESLANLPLYDRPLISSLYRRVCEHIENDEKTELLLNDSMRAVFSAVFDMEQTSWGRYDFALEWNPALLLKAFDFKPDLDRDASLLDNVIALFELCADICFNRPIVFVNAKSYFAHEELEVMFEQAIFCGVQLLLLESWRDDHEYSNERKTVIDQHLLSI